MNTIFETLAAATKPQNKTQFSIYRECVNVLLKVKVCEDVNECSKLCNEIFAIHQKHTKAIKVCQDLKNFESVNGLDFNSWAYDTQTTIEAAHAKAKDKYYDLHFKTYGFNVY